MTREKSKAWHEYWARRRGAVSMKEAWYEFMEIWYEDGARAAHFGEEE